MPSTRTAEDAALASPNSPILRKAPLDDVSRESLNEGTPDPTSTPETEGSSGSAAHTPTEAKRKPGSYAEAACRGKTKGVKPVPPTAADVDIVLPSRTETCSNERSTPVSLPGGCCPPRPIAEADDDEDPAPPAAECSLVKEHPHASAEKAPSKQSSAATTPLLLSTAQAATPCRFFQLGTCRYGDECRYAHVYDSAGLGMMMLPQAYSSAAAASSDMLPAASGDSYAGYRLHRPHAGPNRSYPGGYQAYGTAPRGSQSFSLYQGAPILLPDEHPLTQQSAVSPPTPTTVSSSSESAPTSAKRHNPYNW